MTMIDEAYYDSLENGGHASKLYHKFNAYLEAQQRDNPLIFPKLLDAMNEIIARMQTRQAVFRSYSTVFGEMANEATRQQSGKKFNEGNATTEMLQASLAAMQQSKDRAIAITMNTLQLLALVEDFAVRQPDLFAKDTTVTFGSRLMTSYRDGVALLMNNPHTVFGVHLITVALMREKSPWLYYRAARGLKEITTHIKKTSGWFAAGDCLHEGAHHLTARAADGYNSPLAMALLVDNFHNLMEDYTSAQGIHIAARCALFAPSGSPLSHAAIAQFTVAFNRVKNEKTVSPNELQVFLATYFHQYSIPRTQKPVLNRDFRPVIMTLQRQLVTTLPDTPQSGSCQPAPDRPDPAASASGGADKPQISNDSPRLK